MPSSSPAEFAITNWLPKNAHSGCADGRLHQSAQPVFVGERIDIEQSDPAAIVDHLDRTIVGRREADIFGHWEQFGARIILHDLCEAVAVAAVIDDDQAVGPERLAGDTIQTRLQIVLGMIIDEDDRNPVLVLCCT